MMEMVRGIVDHVFVQNTGRHYNMSKKKKKTLTQLIDIYKNRLRREQIVKEITYVLNGYTSSQLINTCKCAEFCSFPINHRSLHFPAARSCWLNIDKAGSIELLPHYHYDQS